MRSVLGAISLLLLAGSAQAATLWNEHIGQWRVTAYADDQTGAFSSCIASARYQSGTYLLFSVSNSFSWNMGFANPQWQLRKDNDTA
jgi:hypothetical protein